MLGLPNMRVLAGVIFFITGISLWALMIFILATSPDEPDTMLGAANGFFFGLVFCFLPLAVVGAFLLYNGMKAHRSDYKPLLAMIRSRGRVQLWEVAGELSRSPDQIKQLIYRAVSENEFDGYICWDDGILYSADVEAVNESRECPRCGGRIEPSGLRILRCTACDTEVFVRRP